MARVSSPTMSVARGQTSCAPKIRPLAPSVTSLTYPLSVPSMRHLPLAPVRYFPVFTGITAALAPSSVSPTEAISGSV